MARDIVEICNRCGANADSSNHWWVLMPASGGGITVQRFDEKLLGANTEVYCGDRCLLARISELISIPRRPGSVAA